MPTIELTQETYDALIAEANGCEIDLFISNLVDVCAKQVVFSTVRSIPKYYDTEKYKITAAADRERARNARTHPASKGVTAVPAGSRQAKNIPAEPVHLEKTLKDCS